MFEEDGWSLSSRLASGELAVALESSVPAELSDDQLVEVMRGWERLASWVAARQLDSIAELCRRRPRLVAEHDGGHPQAPAVSEFAVDELAAALRLSRCAAGIRLHLAVELAERLPGTAAALRGGALDVAKARAVVESTSPLAAPLANAVEQSVLPRAEAQTVGQLRASLSRAVLKIDPRDAEARHELESTARRVSLRPLPDGMAELWALLPADAAATVYNALDMIAREASSADRRSADARRADALVDLAASALQLRPASVSDGVRARPAGSRPTPAATPMAPAAGHPTRRAPRADVHVTMSAATLLGLADEPAQLAGYGAIPASMARRLAADGRWRRILTDPISGAVLDVGRRRYLPPPALAEHVRTRDHTCRFPGCRQPAHRCDLDHTIPYPQGPTSADNLAALCRHHHRLKHLGTWRVEQPESGVLIWTTPTGHRYRTDPPAPAPPEEAAVSLGTTSE